MAGILAGHLTWPSPIASRCPITGQGLSKFGLPAYFWAFPVEDVDGDRHQEC